MKRRTAAFADFVFVGRQLTAAGAVDALEFLAEYDGKSPPKRAGPSDDGTMPPLSNGLACAWHVLDDLQPALQR